MNGFERASVGGNVTFGNGMSMDGGFRNKNYLVPLADANCVVLSHNDADGIMAALAACKHYGHFFKVHLKTIGDPNEAMKYVDLYDEMESVKQIVVTDLGGLNTSDVRTNIVYIDHHIADESRKMHTTEWHTDGYLMNARILEFGMSAAEAVYHTLVGKAGICKDDYNAVQIVTDWDTWRWVDLPISHTGMDRIRKAQYLMAILYGLEEEDIIDYVGTDMVPGLTLTASLMGLMTMKTYVAINMLNQADSHCKQIISDGIVHKFRGGDMDMDMFVLPEVNELMSYKVEVIRQNLEKDVPLVFVVPTKYKSISLRGSKKHDVEVRSTAVGFGGNGHPFAAGYSVKGMLDSEESKARIDEMEVSDWYKYWAVNAMDILERISSAIIANNKERGEK